MAKKVPADRGYARNAREEAILADAGVLMRTIYLEGRGSETLAAVRMRPGEMLATANGFRALGASRRAIMTQVSRIHGEGAAILDVRNGRRSDRNGAEMLDAALRAIQGESVMTPEKGEEMGRKSGRARTKGRMAVRQAMMLWRNPNLTTPEAIQQMRGWTARTAYEHFGKRGLPRGPIGKRD